MVPPARLRPATAADAEILLGWIPDAEACRLWAGPHVTYPATPESLWAELDDPGAMNWALILDDERMVGFGQSWGGVTDCVHLARLIVAPEARGQGLGRTLCERLMECAVARHAPRAFTLNVYVRNTAAVALYRSLGFEPAQPGLGDFELRVLRRAAGK